MKRLKSGTALAVILLIGACETIAPATDSSTLTIEAPVESEASLLSQVYDLQSDAPAFQVSETYASANIEDGTLTIDFDVFDDISEVSLTTTEPQDWSVLEDTNLAFDLTNPMDTSIQLYISLTDANGFYQHRSISVPAGSSGTYFIIIDGPTTDIDSGMREIPDPWPADDETMLIWRSGTRSAGEFDWAQIAELNFFVRGNIREKSVEVKNIRFRENSPVPEDYLKGISDAFGQNAMVDFPIKVDSEEELRAVAQAELADLAANPGFPDRSRFGGWKDGPKLDATGYFRVEKVDGKWWMVDPEGNLFFSHGVANVRMANSTTITGIDFADESIREVSDDEVTPEDSIGIVAVSDEVRATRFVASETRRDMFEWLPDYDHPLADHYSYRRSVHRGPVKSGETFSFYRANLERRYGETTPKSYLRDWEQVTLDRMKSWGFTSFGNWVDPAFYPNEQVPYFANGWIIGDFQTLASGYDVWAPMPDFFDPKFAERARATISVVAEEVQGSPWCVGIFIDNEKSWGMREGSVELRYGIILDALSKDASASYAKAAFVDALEQKYGDLAALNAAWGSEYAAWDELSSGITFETFSDAITADLSFLMEVFSDQYFKVVHDTLEEYLPNHLYMGARMASWGMPDETIKAALKYSDVMSFNIYKEGLQHHPWAFLAEIDKPVVIGEFHIGATSDSGMFHHGLVMASDQADRARIYRKYMETVTSNPYLVGAHWFQYTDSPLTGRAFDGENYNVGFVNIADIPYPEMVEAAREIMDGIYPERFGLAVEP